MFDITILILAITLVKLIILIAALKNAKFFLETLDGVDTFSSTLVPAPTNLAIVSG